MSIIIEQLKEKMLLHQSDNEDNKHRFNLFMVDGAE